jgi:hypothetical protein
MGNQTDYFNRIGYKSVYSIGDRIKGKWNGIPFVGTVGNDTLINHEEGPRISVHLDLPIKYGDKLHNFIIVKHDTVTVYK